jgi:hypothetical protein
MSEALYPIWTDLLAGLVADTCKLNVIRKTVHNKVDTL